MGGLVRRVWLQQELRISRNAATSVEYTTAIGKQRQFLAVVTAK